MAYRFVHGSDYAYTRDGFGRRTYESAEPVRTGISRGLFAGTLLAAVLLALWSGAATFYILFRDEALVALAARQVSVSRSYDARISALDAEIERLRSVRFIDQERVERQLAELSRIQRTIEARHTALSALAQSFARMNSDITGSIPPSPAVLKATPAPPVPQPNENAKPRPLSDVILVEPPLKNAALLQSRVLAPAAAAVPASEPVQREIAAVSQLLKRLGAEQAGALNAIETELDERSARARKVLAELGSSRLKRPVQEQPTQEIQAAPVGGPFIPISQVPEDAFMRQVFRVRHSASEHERLIKQFEGLPVLLPVSGDAEITSGFGARVDPFLKQLAFHAGVDLRGDNGDPVRATAAGIVVFAGKHPAYGLMVEIDHGNGHATRYAHLSAILVKEGAVLKAGAVLGKIGSTGRSTGPHLHYEVRLNGEPIDPRRYLRAGRRLLSQ
jgi:murein DD-endopeptidase MepM/ murein hydrolase activator NlpD